MKVHHIGYLVKNMEKAEEGFFLLGYKEISAPVYDPIRKINICFLKNGETVVELIESAAADSAVDGMFKKIGVAPYHICYIVKSLDQAIDEMRENHYIMTAKPETAPALDNKRVAFFYNRDCGLIELLEE